METLFSRKKHVITTIADGSSESFKSINKTKKESRKLQNSNGGLGRGSLVKG